MEPDKEFVLSSKLDVVPVDQGLIFKAVAVNSESLLADEEGRPMILIGLSREDASQLVRALYKFAAAAGDEEFADGEGAEGEPSGYRIKSVYSEDDLPNGGAES